MAWLKRNEEGTAFFTTVSLVRATYMKNVRILIEQVAQMERNSMIDELIMISILAENLAKELIVEEELEKIDSAPSKVTINISCTKKEAK